MAQLKSGTTIGGNVAFHTGNLTSANIGSITYAAATGSANAYTVTLNPAPTSLVEGLCVAVKINVDNTGASTLNVNGLGAKPIKKPNGNDVSVGDLKASNIYTLRYNGTNFILQSVFPTATEIGAVSTSTYTASDILAKIKTVDGVNSGLDADYVRGEDVIEKITILENNLSREIYDSYRTRLELYYSGYISSINVSNFKGMLFDGFINTNNINSSSTTAVINTTDKLVVCPSSGSTELIPSSVTLITNYNDAIVARSVSNIIDNNTSTTIGNSYSSGYSGYAIITADLGSLKCLQGIKTYGTYTSSGITDISLSPNNSLWLVGSCIHGFSFDSTYSWKSTTWDYAVTSRYVKFKFFINKGNSGYLAEFRVLTATPSSSVLQTVQKTLDTTVSKAVLYITYYTPSGSSITPQVSNNGGTTFKTATLESSQQDTFDSFYTESKYNVTFDTTDNRIILKILLNASGQSSPIIKRYCLYWL
jgi:hypothetical protein